MFGALVLNVLHFRLGEYLSCCFNQAAQHMVQPDKCTIQSDWY